MFRYNVLLKRASIGHVMALIRLIGNIFTPKVQETSLRSVKRWGGIDVCTTSISRSTHSHQSTELDEDLSSFLSAVLCRFRTLYKYIKANASSDSISRVSASWYASPNFYGQLSTSGQQPS